jgi:hypothetical protein
VTAIQENDEAKIEQAVLRLSRSRRIFAPFTLAISALLFLFAGLRLLPSNWRLTLVQVLPAMWLWLAMLDLKAHVLHGRSLNEIRGPVLIPLALVVIAITTASAFLNAVFAMAVAAPPPPRVRPAMVQARSRLVPIVATGVVLGTALAVAVLIAPRWHRPWFTLTLGSVVGVGMVSYVAVPARLIGVKPRQSTREKLTMSALGGVIGATVCTPPYLLGRLGILMLGSKILLVPGIIVLALGLTLQAGATGAVRAIKFSAKLGAGRNIEGDTLEPS